MSKPLPYGKFKWVYPDTSFYINELNEIVVVDTIIPEKERYRSYI